MTDASVVREVDLFVTTLHITYALHAVGLAIAVIINYVTPGEARGTWLESHFEWQIKTFWYAVAASILIALGGLLPSIVLTGVAIWAIGFLVLGIWAIYRLAKGWMRLNLENVVRF